MNQEEVLEKLKKDVRSLLVSAKEGLTPDRLRKDYGSMLGHPMPLRVLGFRTVVDMAQDMPDVVNITYMPDGSLVMKAVADETTRGIQELVARQRVSRPKSKAGRGGVFSFSPRNLSQSRVVLPRRGRPPPAMPALLRAQLQQLLTQGPLRVSELENSFRRCFGHPLRVNDYGFYSLGEMLDVARDLVTVEQGRLGSVISLRNWNTQPPALQPIMPPPRPAPPPARPPALPATSAERFTPRPVQVPPAPRSPQQGSKAPLRDLRVMASPQRAASTHNAVGVGAHNAVGVVAHNAVGVSTHNAMGVGAHNSVGVGTHNALAVGGAHSVLGGGGLAQQSAVEGSRRVEAQQNREEAQPQPQPSQREDSFEKSIIQLEAELRQRILENGVAGTVSPELKNNLRQVVRQRKDGMSVHELPAEYKRMFGEDLLVVDLGFLSVTELVGALSDIFHLRSIGGDEDHDWIITDIEEDTDTQTGVSVSGAGDIRSYYLSGGESLWEATEEEQEGDYEQEDDIPETSVFTSMSQIQVADLYRHIQVHSEPAVPLDALRGQGLKPPTRRRPRELGAVLVEHVESPGYFYVRFSEAVEGGELEDMMIKMRSSYTSPEVSERYRLTECYVRQGQVCCVAPRDLWFYRVVIHRLLSQSQVEVYYVDFGDVSVVNVDQLKFLKSCYSELPAQAVPSSLAGITPTGGGWSYEATSCFKRMCCDRLLVAALTGYHDDVLQLYLCDTHSEDDVYIHTVLHALGHAHLCTTTTPAPCVQFNPVSLYLGKSLLDLEEPILRSASPQITLQQCEWPRPSPTPSTLKELQTDTVVLDDMPALEFIDVGKVNCHNQEAVKANPFEALFVSDWDRQWIGEPEQPTSTNQTCFDPEQPTSTNLNPAPTILNLTPTIVNPDPNGLNPAPTGHNPASMSHNPTPTRQSPTLSGNIFAPTSNSSAPAPSCHNPLPTGLNATSNSLNATSNSLNPAPTSHNLAPTSQSPTLFGNISALTSNSSAPDSHNHAPSGHNPVSAGLSPASNSLSPAPTSHNPTPTSQSYALFGNISAPTSNSSAPGGHHHAPYDANTAPLSSSTTHSRLSPTPPAVAMAESVLLEDDSEKTALASLDVALPRPQREEPHHDYPAITGGPPGPTPPVVMVPMVMPAYTHNMRTHNLPQMAGGMFGMPVHAPMLPGFFFMGARDFQQTPPYYR